MALPPLVYCSSLVALYLYDARRADEGRREEKAGGERRAAELAN